MPKLANTEQELHGQEQFAEAAQRLFRVARAMLGTASPSRARHLVTQARKCLETIEENVVHLPED